MPVLRQAFLIIAYDTGLSKFDVAIAKIYK
jgi:hypothetical protein